MRSGLQRYEIKFNLQSGVDKKMRFFLFPHSFVLITETNRAVLCIHTVYNARAMSTEPLTVRRRVHLICRIHTMQANNKSNA